MLRFTTLLTSLLSATSLAYPTAYNNIPLNCNGSALLPTPTYGLAGANFSVCATVKIKVPVELVSNTILDFLNYKKWNTFVFDAMPPPNVYGPDDICVGQSIVFKTRGIPAGTENVGTDIVTFVERPKFAAWKNIENEQFIGHSEHCFLFWRLPGGYTQFTHWQTQFGPNAGVIFGLKPDFQTQFEVEARDLKAYLESWWAAEAERGTK